eukprot:5369464-Prymnesium_polylepis.1
MTHAVAAWPPDRPGRVLWWVRRPMCGAPVCPWQAPAIPCCRALSTHVSETRARSKGMSDGEGTVDVHLSR